jgi:aminotransferase
MRDALSKKIVDIEPSGIRKFFDVVSEIPDAISLGVGEPDFDTPWNVREEGIYALEKGRTFYTSNAGLKELRQEISRYVARKYDTQYDPMKQVLVTVGGSEAIDVALRCMVDPGDEVLIPQPSYVSYLPCAVMADAVPVFINLKEENQFKLTKEELLEHITDKTKILIMPFPNNPTGAIMTREELMELVPVIIEKDLYVISDEIYSELTYGDNKHCSIASLPGMKERTIMINGFSKAFAMTGWRLGYVIANPQIIDRVKKVHDFLTVGAAAPLMEAAVVGLEFGDGYYDELAAHYAHMKEIFVGGLKKLGLKYTDPQGAYYVLVDVSEFGVKDDVKFCEWLAQYVGVAAVPGSSFFREDVNNLIRFHFAKQDDTLNEAINRLAGLRKAVAEAGDVEWR